MNPSRSNSILLLAFLLLIVAVGILCVSPAYELRPVTVGISLLKVLSLLTASAAGFVAFGRLGHRDWLLLASGLFLYSLGQLVLAFYQIVRNTQVPFPSLGDPFFILASVLIIWSIFTFCLTSWRSGLPLGTFAAFWGPALAGFVLFVVGAIPLLAPIVQADAHWYETFLNVFYPVSSFVTLAPCLVMLRVGLKFRGGKLLQVWFPITCGFMAVLISDILFSYLSTLGQAWTLQLVDFLYSSGYLLIALGILTQARLVGNRP